MGLFILPFSLISLSPLPPLPLPLDSRVLCPPFSVLWPAIVRGPSIVPPSWAYGFVAMMLFLCGLQVLESARYRILVGVPWGGGARRCSRHDVCVALANLLCLALNHDLLSQRPNRPRFTG